MMSALQTLLSQFRELTQTERDKGTAFEKLMIRYFEHEPYYRSQYAKVQTYAEWVQEHFESLGLNSKTDGAEVD